MLKLLSIAALGLCSTASAAPAIQALILTGHDHHDWRSTTPYLRKLLEESGRFEVRVEEEPAGITAGTLARFDVLILHYNGVRWPAATEQAVLDFVRAGKGAVALHAATYTFAGLKTQGPEFHDREFVEPAWTEWWKLVGAHWPLAPGASGHAGRKVFTVKFSEPRHPITAGLPATFRISDELYHNLPREEGLEVLATAFDQSTRKDEPQLWAHRYGSGRVVYEAWGHDLAAMHEPEFGATFTRAAEWVATGKVEPAAAGAASPRVLVVTGGHEFEPSFYGLFGEFRWTHAAGGAQQAFKKDIRASTDVLVLYNYEQQIGERERENLRAFLESGKGLVVLHHALCNWNDWEWWYRDVVGAKYQVKAAEGQPAATYKHDQDLVVRLAMPPRNAHPVLSGIWDMHITDETYKGMWISPEVKVLLRTDDPASDGPVAWISPYAKSRVVAIQLGHDHMAHEHPGYRGLVRNAVMRRQPDVDVRRGPEVRPTRSEAHRERQLHLARVADNR